MESTVGVSAVEPEARVGAGALSLLRWLAFALLMILLALLGFGLAFAASLSLAGLATIGILGVVTAYALMQVLVLALRIAAEP